MLSSALAYGSYSYSLRFLWRGLQICSCLWVAKHVPIAAKAYGGL